MQMQSTNYKLYKYADDMALVALLWKDCIDYEYEEHVLKWEKGCKASSLLRNVGKTNPCEPWTEITLCDQPVGIVKVFKYLGIMIDCKIIFFW